VLRELAIFALKRLDAWMLPAITETIEKLRVAGHALAPRGAVFEVAAVDDCGTHLSPNEQAWMASWSPHRQQEFATGRLCARRAASALGVELPDLLPDAEGVPAWPAELAASISHCRGVALVLVARSRYCPWLGLDLEKTNRLSERAWRKVVHPREREFVAEVQLRASILFSLKEAFYKAQFPRWRMVGNFHDLALEVDLAAGTAQVLEMAPRFAPDLREARFAFCLVEDYVLSVCNA
jgi:4'-phosphopantetheinyl transferase EntD